MNWQHRPFKDLGPIPVRYQPTDGKPYILSIVFTFLCTIADLRRNAKLVDLSRFMLGFARAYIEYSSPDHYQEIYASLSPSIKYEVQSSTTIDQTIAIKSWNEQMVLFAFYHIRSNYDMSTNNSIQTRIVLLPCRAMPGDFVVRLRTEHLGSATHFEYLEHEVVLREVNASNVRNTKMILDIPHDRHRYRSWSQDREHFHLISVTAHSLPSNTAGLHTEIVLI